MSNKQSDLNELMALQQDVAELKADEKSARTTTEVPADEDVAVATDELESKVEDFGEQIDAFVKELEAAAKERPRVALLAAFAIGVAIGQMLSRR